MNSPGNPNPKRERGLFSPCFLAHASGYEVKVNSQVRHWLNAIHDFDGISDACHQHFFWCVTQIDRRRSLSAERRGGGGVFGEMQRGVDAEVDSEKLIPSAEHPKQEAAVAELADALG